MDNNPDFDPLRLEDRAPITDPARYQPGPNPYYIVTPRYVRTSAGIKALHLLCHCLNRVGHEAYILIYPDWINPEVTNPDLLTPVVTPEITARHRAQGLSPIVVYPETIPGNPLGARTIVRYVLNFPGHLAGDRAYKPREIVFGYSTVLAEAGGAPDQVLFIPASNTRIFTPGEPVARRGSCYWAMKYKLVHGAEPLPVTAASIEITREQPNSQQPAAIADLFRRSELFYAYENTALVLEAALCLCPTVFLPNPWLTEAIAAKEMGTDGFAWGTDPAEIARAKATVHLARERYLSNYVNFWEQLSGFVSTTQTRAAEDMAQWKFSRATIWKMRWRPKIEAHVFLVHRMIRVFSQEGPRAVWQKLQRKIARDAHARMQKSV